MAEVRHFFSKVSGVSHENDDGTSRQKFIKKCRQFDLLILDHEEDNPYDRNAVKVCRESGDQIGYLQRKLAEEVVERSPKGYRYAVFIADITGGGLGKKTHGVNLLVIVCEPGTTDEEAQEYLDNVIKEGI